MARTNRRAASLAVLLALAGLPAAAREAIDIPPPPLLAGAGRPCEKQAPKGGIYIRTEASGRPSIPALYRTEDGSLTYDAVVANPASRWNFHAQPGTRIAYTVWISNPAQGCLWTYRIYEMPPQAPASPMGRWPKSPDIEEIALKPVY